MRILEHAFSIVSLLSLLLLGPALGRALLLWWDKRRERSLPSQYIALATCTMIALTGLIMVYGVVWQANHRMVAWYSWIDAIPVNADVSAIRLGAREVRLKCLSLISSFRQSLKRFSLLGSHWRDEVQFFDHPRWREATRGGGRVLSFVPAEHILDGIHDGRISVFVAIAVKLLLILFDCFGLDDRVAAFAVVVPAKPQLDLPLGPRELLHQNLLARYFSNVDCHLCLRCRHLHKQE